jgi:hypothetical protein
MKPEIKKLWLKALRSGKYRQTKEKLSDGKGRFCCLGVLCDLHAKAKRAKWGKNDDGDMTYLGEWETLPFDVQRWAGLDDENPDVTHEHGNCLAALNDNGKRFTTIANVIEAQL